MHFIKIRTEKIVFVGIILGAKDGIGLRGAMDGRGGGGGGGGTFHHFRTTVNNMNYHKNPSRFMHYRYYPKSKMHK